MALSDLMESFKGTPAPAPAPAPVVAPATNIQPPADNSAPADSNNPTGSESPLDTFKDLWETDPNKQADTNTSLLGEINPQKILEQASKVNFAKIVKPEDVKLIQQGGEGAVEALGRALNATSQAVYAQSAVATAKIVEQATSRLEEKILASLPERIKQQSFSNSLREDNPAYSHPSAAPIVAMIETQMQTKFPNATTAELKEMAKDYFTKTFSAISGADATAAKTKQEAASKEIDWSKEFGIS